MKLKMAQHGMSKEALDLFYNEVEEVGVNYSTMMSQ